MVKECGGAYLRSKNAMAALFKKKNETTIAELEEYYANQKKGRSATAWFMAFLSILITVAIIVGLFFAGRWIYRTFIDDDSSDNITTEVSDGEEVSLPTFDSDSANGDIGVGFEEGSSNNPDDLVFVDNSEPTQDYPAVVGDEAAVTNESNVDRLASNDSSSDDTADTAIGGSTTTDVGGATTTPETVPNTGPGETILIALVATTVLGYVGSLRFFTKK